MGHSLSRLLASFVLIGGAAGPALGAEPTEAAGSVSYQRDIVPILTDHCVSCHGKQMSRAGLRLHTPFSILAGGRSGPAVVIGQPETSLLLIKAANPAKDQEGHRAPGLGGNPVSDAQLALIKQWIQDGVVFGTPSPAGGGDGASQDLQLGDPLPPKMLIKLRSSNTWYLQDLDDGGMVAALSSGHGFGPMIPRPKEPERELKPSLAMLDEFRLLIRHLDLRECPIKDGDLDGLRRFANLEFLNLSRAQVDNRLYPVLKDLPKLKVLCLYKTDVDDQGMDDLAAVPALTAVVLKGSSKVTPAGIARLKSLNPNLRVVAEVKDLVGLERYPPVVRLISDTSTSDD